MSTVEVEILRKEAKEEEKREIEELRQKYKQRQKQRQQQNTPQNNTNPEKEALIQQAQQQEQQEKEQIRQKLKQRQKQRQQQNTPQNNTNPEKEALIQQAQQQEQQEKEQIRQKYKQRQKQRQQQNTPQNTTYLEKEDNEQNKNTTTKNPEKEDLYKRALNREIIENDDIWEQFLVKKSKQNAERFNQSEESYEYELESEGLETDGIESEKLGIAELNGENDQLETVDRSALLAKYNIKDVQEDDVTNLLENFDRSITDENVEEIEERLMETIKHSALSHPKIEWVNVLVFLDEEQMIGNIKILAEYDDKNFIKRIISDNNKKLEVELIQIALYEVWDVFTTLGVNTNDLESKIEVEVELDRA
nr:hypothetical protein [uncultured Methanobacterium sp.]